MFFFVVIAIGLLLSVFLFIGGIVQFIQRQSAAHWPVAKGLVIESYIHSMFTPYDEQSQTPATTNYMLVLHYVFSEHQDITKEKYTRLKGTTGAYKKNFRIDWTQQNPKYSSDEKQIQKYLDKYPEGKEVNVYYDPKNPLNCVLENDYNKGLLYEGFHLILPLFLVIPFLLVFLWMLKEIANE